MDKIDIDNQSYILMLGIHQVKYWLHLLPCWERINYIHKPYSFFFIGNQKTIINEKKGKVQVVHDDEQQEKKNKQHSKTRSQETKLREDINSEREEQSVKPQQRDHSKRLRWHKTFNSSNVFSLF